MIIQDASTEGEPISLGITSVVSHQFKTPLSSIKGAVEVILSGELGPVEPKQEEYLGLVLNEVEGMISLVKDLLDAYKVEQGGFTLEKEPKNLKEMVQKEIGRLASIARARNAFLTLNAPDDLPPVLLDEVKIQAVVNNFLVNAIRYNTKKGEIMLTLSREGGSVVFSCKDNGIGISKEDAPHLFSKFFRGKNALSVAPSGSGLGLFIAKAIIEQSGGQLWFESEENKGSTFYFSLPLTS